MADSVEFPNGEFPEPEDSPNQFDGRDNLDDDFDDADAENASGQDDFTEVLAPADAGGGSDQEGLGLYAGKVRGVSIE